jgi:hypothetical protein
MIDRNMARGLFLAALALLFGLGAFRYPIGTMSRAGPGLFPLLVSSALLLIAIATIVRARYVPRIPMEFNPRNIGLLLGALVAFSLVSHLVNMAAGIVVMVVIASFAASTFSWKRVVQVAAGLVAIAFAFQKLLGLNLPLL